VPSTSAGVHSILIRDANTNFRITLSRLPQISGNYFAFWHISDFTINLSPDYSGTEIFYRLNNGSVCSVSVDGQPRITAETSTGTLEYWGTWNLYGTGHIELSHVYLTAIKLDKTSPTGTITSSAHTNTTAVSLVLSATDAISGVTQMRFSNDNLTWSNWETYSLSKLWTMQSGNGEKTVFVQYKDNAGLISTYSCTITLELPQPTATPTQTTNPTASPNPSTTPQIPEFNAQITLLLIALLSLSAVIFGKYKGKQPLFNP
jgi:hypothetical protein